MSEVYAYLGVGGIFVVLGTASLLGKLPLNYLAGIRIEPPQVLCRFYAGRELWCEVS